MFVPEEQTVRSGRRVHTHVIPLSLMHRTNTRYHGDRQVFLKNRACGQAGASCVRYAEVVFHSVEMVDATTGTLDVRDFTVRLDVSEQAILVGEGSTYGAPFVK